MNDKNKPQKISPAIQTALNLSHGVKNILQAIKSSTELLEKNLDCGNINAARKGMKILGSNL